MPCPVKCNCSYLKGTLLSCTGAHMGFHNWNWLSVATLGSKGWMKMVKLLLIIVV